MTANIGQLEAAIAALEAQRALLGDATVDAGLAPIRDRLAQLRAQSLESAQQLKAVSVLFVDIVGSTAMSRMLDPEDIHAVVDGALARFSAVVAARGGKVLQYAGDSMLAAFGADGAHENDAENAVHAALAIVAEARAISADVERTHRLSGFDVRAGINTGPVLLGGGVDDEGSIRGLTVNVAARMEQSAPAGGLRISHDTYRHVRGIFDVSEETLVTVKGIDEPLRSYLVVRAKPRAFRLANRGVEGVEMPDGRPRPRAAPADRRARGHDRRLDGDAADGRRRRRARQEPAAAGVRDVARAAAAGRVVLRVARADARRDAAVRRRPRSCSAGASRSRTATRCRGRATS